MHHFCRDESWISKHLFFDMFSDFECQFFFGFWREFCERAVKNVIFVSRRFFWRDDKFWDIAFFWFLSLIAKISDFWLKTFAWFWKLKFKWPQDYFQEKNASMKPLIPDFFRNLSGKLLRYRWIFSGDLTKGNLWRQGSF